MSEINATKVEFKLELADAGLNVLEYIPERITPPIVIMNSAQPYLQTAQFGEWSLGLELVLVAATSKHKTLYFKSEEPTTHATRTWLIYL